MPREWQQTLWDDDGQSTRNPSKGQVILAKVWKWKDERPLTDLVRQMWNEPEGRIVQSGTATPEDEDCDGHDEPLGG